MVSNELKSVKFPPWRDNISKLKFRASFALRGSVRSKLLPYLFTVEIDSYQLVWYQILRLVNSRWSRFCAWCLRPVPANAYESSWRDCTLCTLCKIHPFPSLEGKSTSFNSRWRLLEKDGPTTGNNMSLRKSLVSCF